MLRANCPGAVSGSVIFPAIAGARPAIAVFTQQLLGGHQHQQLLEK